MDCSKAPEGGSGGRSKEKNQNIQVFVRVRKVLMKHVVGYPSDNDKIGPMNNQEISKHAGEVIDTPGNREVVVKERAVSNVSKTFTFDRVFGPRSKQIDVYKQVVSPLLAEVLLGYNCTVFAYGQTGTGKTFTMEGERKSNFGVESDPCAGILPRALSELFDELRQMNCEFSVRASFLELYNEELFDLLAPIEESKAKTLRLFEDVNRKGSVIIQGLEEVIVNNKHEVYAVLDRGSQQRKTAATLMNATSSRSHTIFTILVHIKESSVEGEEMVKVGKLHLVDLAGSENIGKSGAVDKRAREAGSINQSLLTLGRVISALVERTPHIPYRESKLTRLLQDSLGGKTKTSIIATISPATSNIEETLSTLDYAHRAKNIMNRPEVNQKISKKEAITMYTDEIERLRKDLNAARGKDGFFVDLENYNSLMAQIQSQNCELNEKSNKIKELEDSLTTKENEYTEAVQTIDDLQLDVQTKQAIMDNLKAQKAKLESNLAFYGRKNDELKHLLKYHEVTEEKMSSEATTLLDTTKTTVYMIEQLHERLDRKQLVQETNLRNAERFKDDFAKAVNEIIDTVGETKQSHTIGISRLRELLNKRSAEQKENMEMFSALFHTTIARMDGLHTTLAEICTRYKSTAESRFEAIGNSVARETENEKMKMTSSLDSCSALIGSLSKQFIEIKGGLKSLEKEIETKFNSMNQVVNDVLKSNLNRFNKTDEALVDLRNKWGAAVQAVQAKSDAVQAVQERFKTEYEKKISSICDSLHELRVDTENHLAETGTAFSSINNKLETSTNEIGCKITKESDNIRCTRLQTEKALQNADKFRTENVTNHQAVLGRMHDRVEAQANNAKSIQKQLTESGRVFAEGMTSLAHQVTESSNTALKMLAEVEIRMGDANDHQVDELEVLHNGCFDNVKAITDGESKCIEKLVQHLDEQCDCISTGCAEAGSSLAQVSGMVDEFWEETYLTDGRTGGTPMRRNFDYPTALSKPSPSTRVLARYRHLQNDVQHAIDECIDGSDNDSYASTLQDDRHSQEGTISNPGEYDLSDETENADPEFEVEVELASSASSTSEKSEPSKETAKADKKNQPKEKEKKKDSDSEVPRTPAPAPKSKPEPSDNPGKKNQPKDAEKKKGSDSEVTQTPAPKKSDEKDNKAGKPQTEVKNPGKQSKRQKRKSGGGQKGVLRPPN